MKILNLVRKFYYISLKNCQYHTNPTNSYRIHRINLSTRLNFALMCGIAGVFHFNSKIVDLESIRKMNDIAHHRGPDDEGYVLINTTNNLFQNLLGEKSDPKISGKYPHIESFQNESYNLCLAYKRLAIIDLSISGHQPMTDETGKFWLHFNGEIYNYLEIKKELQTYGFVFHSNSDSEVLLKSYIQWGYDCVHKFIGMFAFVIWDSDKKVLYGARDRFGVKPFNYYIDDEKFIWGSEEKQIIASRLIKFEFNTHSTQRFFLLNQLHDSGETFVNRINKIPSAHYFTIHNNKINFKKYWEIDPNKSLQLNSDEEKVEQFKYLFNDAVKLRLRADVPIGIALSGGLDSSSIAITSRNILKNTVKTFSVYYEQDKKYDEREYIQSVLDTGGFQPTYYTQDEQINIDSIRNWIFKQDGPTSGASPYSAFLNYKNVRASGITVLLNGQGGDETLAGYPYYFKYLLSDQMKNLELVKIYNNLKQWKLDQSLSYSIKQLSGAIFNILFSNKQLLKLENKKYCNSDFYSNKTISSISSVFKLKFNTDLDQALYDTLKIRMLPHLLHWEDRNSMACSIESRVPFLDHRLVEYLFMLPSDYKIKNGVTKIILRKAMNGILPNKILNRRDKKGFGTPTDLWTKGELKKDIQDILYSKQIEERGIWNINKLRKAFATNSFGENELWKIITMEIFIQEFEKLSVQN
ncbi:MAG: asparagine synthase (glutamine-hydrolyzing) [Saprospiraceae bacterium]|nr:asparagine synthase (glutamine-hydrolyzing) [Saprospiraceae bacterium]